MLPCGILTCCSILSSLGLGSPLPMNPPAEMGIWDFSTIFIPVILLRSRLPTVLKIWSISSSIWNLCNLISICSTYWSIIATSISPSYPAVAMWSINTSGHQSRFTDDILLCQSYLSSVPGSIAFCSNENNLNSFSLLSTSFGQSAFSPTYDPWTYVDAFGRGKIYKSLVSANRSAVSESLDRASIPPGQDVSAMGISPAVRFPSEWERRKMERASSGSRSSSVVNESIGGPSKN